ncbi:Hypothetical protein RG540_CH13630 [Neorhizobium galegae bv. orientalis str. HAMBI 540]|uniref:Uncharacterized protein n=1 Tax=Neorhizobium galegae bv. orientalis str. HAMBI 540 TaxID=1028800 RepID=A0A068SMT1_NEOGA|nr:Hypothetical protein RG540_CH13630 [Neorhizobium galegae bv. orientalis str. HAMBI 540]
MIYLRYRDKVERIVDCPRCDGKGFHTLRSDSIILMLPNGQRAPFLTGHSWMCGCTGGKVVTYPWTRGRSLPPLVPRKRPR